MLLITEGVIAGTRAALESAGTRRVRHEGVVYWAGRSVANDQLAIAAIVPHAQTSARNYQVTAEANAHAIAWMCDHGLELVAQVHSHPGEFVEHSDWDDAHAAFPFEGLWSIVVPNYGRRGLVPIEHCGVHRFESGGFRVLDAAEAAASIRILPTVQRVS